MTIDPLLFEAVSEALQQSFDEHDPRVLDIKFICLMIELSHIDPVPVEADSDQPA